MQWKLRNYLWPINRLLIVTCAPAQALCRCVSAEFHLEVITIARTVYHRAGLLYLLRVVDILAARRQNTFTAY